jgi:hypothetical protein
MARGRDNYTGEIRDDIPQAWVERWPDDYTLIEDPAPAPAVDEESASAGTEVKEKADGR